MSANIKALITTVVFCLFSFASVAVEPVTVSSPAAKAETVKTTPQAAEAKEKPKACDFRISVA